MQNTLELFHCIRQIFDVREYGIALTQAALPCLYGERNFDIGNDLTLSGTNRRGGGVVARIDADIKRLLHSLGWG